MADIIKDLVEKERQKQKENKPEERKGDGKNLKRAIPLMTPAGVTGILPGETVELSFTFINGGYKPYHENFHFESKYNEEACKVFNPVKIALPQTRSSDVCEVKVQLQATELAQLSDQVVDFTVTNHNGKAVGHVFSTKVRVCSIEEDEEKLFNKVQELMGTEKSLVASCFGIAFTFD